MRRIRSASNIIKKRCELNTAAGMVPFTLKFSKARKTIAISINAKAEVNVSAPVYASENMVFSFIKEKADWIKERLSEANNKKDIIDRKKYAAGETFLFLGKKFPLKVEEKDIKRANLKFDGSQWIADIPFDLTPKDRHTLIGKKMVDWYRSQAKEILGGRIFHYSRIIGNEPLRIEVKTQKRIWGNCDPRSKTININWQVILSPIDVIDYIVVHELCHLLVPNHSPRFWKKVERILPRYKSQKKWLKDNFLQMLLPGQD